MGLLLQDVKKRISDVVEDKKEAVAVTTAIQEEIFLEMGIEPGFGIGCLGKLNSASENDKELMIGFYKFLASREEMACEEAELGPDGFEQKMRAQQLLLCCKNRNCFFANSSVPW
ncbi:PREDICTED: uncharacterized protein LOC104737649 isoform X1 [Camelina sativa]|uniref:Uncharacterized protein LOC104737649 isoform X1 n=1 Tax=Camelina sativa TaxID=90675 RepID=A0ABM0VHD8_CAMSA|nr:PREDICTED: uncharacterized protein LOC104737649 isoform X1 [Camelina sativa]